MTDETVRFIKAIKGDSDVNCWFKTIFENKKRLDDQPSLRRTTDKESNLSDYGVALDKLNSDDHGVFMAINDIKSGGPRTADNVELIRALFIDVDDGRETPPEWALEPSVVVRTSESGKWQAYWLVSDCPVSDFSNNQRQLIAHWNSDPAPQDPNRIMRVPGFSHRKYEPIKSVLLKCRADLVYKVSQVLEAYPAEFNKRETHGLMAVEDSDDYDKFYAWAKSLADSRGEEGSRNKTAIYIAGQAKAMLCTEDQAYTAVQGYCELVGTADRKNGKEASDSVRWAYDNITEGWTPVLVDVFMKAKTKALISELKTSKDKMTLIDNAKILGKMSEAQWTVFKDEAIVSLGMKSGELGRMRVDEVGKAIGARIKREIKRIEGLGGVVIHSYNEYDYLAQCYKDSTSGLVYYREDWLVYEDGVYVVAPIEEFKTYLRQWLIERVFVFDKKTGMPLPFKATTNHVLQTETALRSLCLLRSTVDLPCWRGADKGEVINFENGLLRLRGRELIEHSNRYITTSQLGFAYDASAKCDVFKRSMMSWFPSDSESILLVQKIIGYLLSSDTSRQKMFVFIGGSRTGKSTITNIIKKLIPESRNTSLSALGGDFGLEPLIHAQLAIIGDAHLGRTDKQMVLDRLKGISGEDPQSVNRKNKPIVDAKIRARILMATNEMFSFSDPSGALAKRTIPVCFDTSFYGNEDLELSSKLESELSGICAWGLNGLDKLRLSGFSMPAKSRDIVDSMSELNSPMATFFKDSVEICSGSDVEVGLMYEKYRDWCAKNGIKQESNFKFRSEFCDEKGAKIKGTQVRKKGTLERIRVYYGVKFS